MSIMYIIVYDILVGCTRYISRYIYMYIYILMIWYLIRVAKLKYNIIMSQSYPRGKVHIDTSQDPCILMLLMTGKVQPFFEY